MRYQAHKTFNLGAIQDSSDGKQYKYVQLVDAVSENDLTVWDDTSLTKVVKTYANGIVANKLPAGRCNATATAGQYGWIQVSGSGICTDTGGAVAAGDKVSIGGGDGSVVTATVADAEGESQDIYVGISLSASASNLVVVKLDLI